jgi:hypothetical protein
MTLLQMVEETRPWPPGKLGERVGRPTKAWDASDPERDNSWRREIFHRIQEIQAGKIEGILGEKVSAWVRQIVGRFHH